MSLLMFRIDPDVGVLILTDTLATGPNGAPHMFVSKCYTVPHMRVSMAGTGVAAIIDRWGHALNRSMIALSPDMATLHTPRALRDIEASVAQELPGQPLPTTTVYHFGQGDDGDWLWYAFRSRNGFEAERHVGGGFAVKPEPNDPLKESHCDSLETMIALAERVRREQDASPDGVGIGGELWLTAMQPDGVFLQRPIFRWPDFDTHCSAMNHAFDREHVEE